MDRYRVELEFEPDSIAVQALVTSTSGGKALDSVVNGSLAGILGHPTAIRVTKIQPTAAVEPQTMHPDTPSPDAGAKLGGGHSPTAVGGRDGNERCVHCGAAFAAHSIGASKWPFASKLPCMGRKAFFLSVGERP